jgi:hypothetical protein
MSDLHMILLHSAYIYKISINDKIFEIIINA